MQRSTPQEKTGSGVAGEQHGICSTRCTAHREKPMNVKLPICHRCGGSKTKRVGCLNSDPGITHHTLPDSHLLHGNESPGSHASAAVPGVRWRHQPLFLGHDTFRLWGKARLCFYAYRRPQRRHFISHNHHGRPSEPGPEGQRNPTLPFARQTAPTAAGK